MDVRKTIRKNRRVERRVKERREEMTWMKRRTEICNKEWIGQNKAEGVNKRKEGRTW